MHVYLLRAHPDREQMDRRRFESAHLKYACLQMAAKYPEAFSTKYIRVDCCVSHTFDEITPLLFKCFETQYAG